MGEQGNTKNVFFSEPSTYKDGYKMDHCILSTSIE